MSIYSKIRIIFLVTILFVTAFFGTYSYIQEQGHFKQIRMRYAQTAFYMARYFKHQQKKDMTEMFKDSNLKAFLKESDFVFVKDLKQIKYITKDGHVMHKRKIMRRYKLKIIVWHRTQYLYIFDKKAETHPVMLRDTIAPIFPWKQLIGYLGVLFLLLLLYVWLTRSLRPLKTLQSQIKKMGSGDLSIRTISDANDEIGLVANTLDDALRKLESMVQSRQLFLRSIMHELKTPIAKGKLLNEFLHEEKHREGYDAIFERLELLIEEFARIEQMLSSNYTLKLSDYHAIDIVEQSLELMMLSDEEIEKQVTIHRKSDFKLHTDFELLSLAIKNLIDNAIKYSFEHKVIITIESNTIKISNRSEKFTDSIEKYAKPFHDQKHGLGLGLYIVWQIIDMLSLEIRYDYEDGYSTFKITRCGSQAGEKI